ncbi:hypothetical protein PS007_24230, partial [Shigella sonnei]|nr:hypothetical protein [Shigella sonnei]
LILLDDQVVLNKRAFFGAFLIFWGFKKASKNGRLFNTTRSPSNIKCLYRLLDDQVVLNKRAFFGAFLIFWGFKFLSMNCRYEKASIILTSNKGVADWG